MLCQHHGVRVAGIVVNRVIPEKYEQTKKYMTKVLQSMWGIPLLGCIPDKVSSRPSFIAQLNPGLALVFGSSLFWDIPR